MRYDNIFYNHTRGRLIDKCFMSIEGPLVLSPRELGGFIQLDIYLPLIYLKLWRRNIKCIRLLYSANGLDALAEGWLWYASPGRNMLTGIVWYMHVYKRAKTVYFYSYFPGSAASQSLPLLLSNPGIYIILIILCQIRIWYTVVVGHVVSRQHTI